MSGSTSPVNFDAGPATARRLLALIVRQADHGPIRPKAAGVATPPEILEACGLDVGEFYDTLAWLADHGLVVVDGAYPFEEITPTPAARIILGA
jgi:hypothetical protein